MDGSGGNVVVEGAAEVKLTPATRYYRLHAEEKKAKVLAAYHSRPDVIAKREARERLRAEKAAAKEAQRLEREKLRQERLALAIANSATASRRNHGCP